MKTKLCHTWKICAVLKREVTYYLFGRVLYKYNTAKSFRFIKKEDFKYF